MGRKTNKGADNDILGHLIINAHHAAEKVRLSREAKKAAKRNEELAIFILQKTEESVNIEDLIQLESALQEYDILTAQSPADRQSIKNAQRDYGQLVALVKQMRKDPEAYFLANESIKETNGDYRKLPKVRGPQQISGNKTRLQNRAAFVPTDQRGVWEARIQLASRTEAMLRTLHKSLAANHERLLKAREQAAERKDQKLGGFGPT